MQRARFIRHDGQEIFVLDCSGCEPHEIEQIIDECARQVRARPEKSVLTMTIAGGASFDGKTIERMKELTQVNAPYVRAAAVVGITGLYRVVLNAVVMFSRRKFHLCDSVEEAKAYLASQ
ncbi:MAG: hypothetical protein K0A93_04180 [Desulfuromonadaceae bacterium]|nr:hypothetical protein [Desulfuromonadaceae bacterium]